MSSVTRILGLLGAAWGVGGVLILLGSACVRLIPMAVAGFATEPVVVLAYAVSVVFFLYTEGYRGFQRAFSPRVVARAAALVRSPRPLRVLLAPLFCMGFFGATPRRMIVAWALTGGIVGIVALVRLVPQPWRGAIDAGVVVALAYGAVSIAGFTVRALAGAPPPANPDLPRGEQ